ncbi:MAG: fibrobacter succinogenes major paralogous domain-containing protein [Marinilabiliales bacterium]|nr:fibrobacter succinogenes major paralogous domain-containing protein [Marinilabiliales bacterium]
MPTINDNKTMDGNGVSSFISKIESLDGGTRYYLRAYASNAAGTGYGITKSFTTYPSNVSDVQGFIYNVVVIGTQIWMKENLRTTRYNNGDITRHNLTFNIGYF